MLERILKILMQAAGVGLVALGLFWLFFVYGLELHEAAMAKHTKPPIEQRR